MQPMQPMRSKWRLAGIAAEVATLRTDDGPGAKGGRPGPSGFGPIRPGRPALGVREGSSTVTLTPNVTRGTFAVCWHHYCVPHTGQSPSVRTGGREDGVEADRRVDDSGRAAQLASRFISSPLIPVLVVVTRSLAPPPPNASAR
jgi:hypothetical protein